MNSLLAAAAQLQEHLQNLHWKFCIIGGVAVLRWGEVRVTQDVDVTLLTGFGQEEAFIEKLLAVYRPRPGSTRETALRDRVLLLTGWENTPLDIALGAVDFEERTITRSSLWEVEPNLFLRTCCAEDLVIHKCFANRDKDWVDVDGILARQQNELNFDLVWTELKPLVTLKEEPEILTRLEKKFSRYGKPGASIIPGKSQRKRR